MLERADLDESLEGPVAGEVDELDAPPVTTETPDPTPISLPGVEARTAVSPQAISLPDAEGSVQGMGESFSPVLCKPSTK